MQISSAQLHKNKLHPDNPIVFFDVEMRQTPVGRIVMELFKHLVPKVQSCVWNGLVVFCSMHVEK